MRLTTAYRQGDIVLVSFPFTDLTTTKKRPALVISPDSFNELNQDLILAAITSQPAGDEFALSLRDGDFQEGGLPRKSVVKTSKIFTIHSALILKKIGALKRTRLDEILVQVRRFFS